MVFFWLDKKLEHFRGPLKMPRVHVAVRTVPDARVASPQARESPPGRQGVCPSCPQTPGPGRSGTRGGARPPAVRPSCQHRVPAGASWPQPNLGVASPGSLLRPSLASSSPEVWRSAGARSLSAGRRRPHYLALRLPARLRSGRRPSGRRRRAGGSARASPQRPPRLGPRLRTGLQARRRGAPALGPWESFGSLWRVLC